MTIISMVVAAVEFKEFKHRMRFSFWQQPSWSKYNFSRRYRKVLKTNDSKTATLYHNNGHAVDGSFHDIFHLFLHTAGQLAKRKTSPLITNRIV